MRALQVTFMVLGLGFWLGASALYVHYAKTRPKQAEPETGRTYPYSQIGHVFYLNSQERLRWRCLLLATGICMAVVGGAELYMWRLSKRSNSPPEAGPSSKP